MLLQDWRYALRGFINAPGFAVAAVLSLAIGIGASTAIFSVVQALLLRPLPYADAERLAILWNRSPGLGIPEDWFSTAQYFDIKTNIDVFDQVALAIGANYNLTDDGGGPERVGTLRVSSNLLPMLGAQPVAGRLFNEQEDREGAPAVAVLTYGTWQRRYGGQPSVVGRSVRVNDVPYEIVGVLAPRFDIPREVMPTLGVVEHAEILLSLPLAGNAATIRTREDYNILAKLRPGSTVGNAQAALDALTARLMRDHPDVYPPNGGLTFSAVPLQEQVVGGVRRSIIVLVAAVALVLLVACTNVAGLLLVRAVAREQEIAVRASLGASRRRIVGQLLTESVLLALLGGIAGVALAALGLAGIKASGAASVPRLDEIGLDRTVLVFTSAVSILSGLLFGLVPALRLTRASLYSTVKDGARSTVSSGRALVALELAVSLVLLVAAGLLLRSFAHLLDVPPGFNPSNTLTVELMITGRKYPNAASVLEVYQRLEERLRTLPGVTAVGRVSALPLSQMMAWGPITIEGRPLVPGEAFINVDQRTVGGDYFNTMQIPLIAGRAFNEHDVRTSLLVVVVDAQMADTLWPNGDAIGQRVRVGGADSTLPWFTIVGVVGRVKQDALDTDPRMAMYFAHSQSTGRAMNVVVRASGGPEQLAGAVRAAIRTVDPDLPIYGVRTMADRLGASLATRRFAVQLLSLFALVAMALAVIGVNSVLSYVVNQSRRELGIRLALGATPRQVHRLVLRQGVIVTGAGSALGLAGALATTRFMQSLLFGVTTTDPLTFGAVFGALLLAGVGASYAPARRASRVDPAVSLRAE